MDSGKRTTYIRFARIFRKNAPTDILHRSKRIQTANKYRDVHATERGTRIGVRENGEEQRHDEWETNANNNHHRTTFVSDSRSKWCGKVILYHLHHKTTVQHFDNNIKLDKICYCSKFNFLVHMNKWLYFGSSWCDACVSMAVLLPTETISSLSPSIHTHSTLINAFEWISFFNSTKIRHAFFGGNELYCRGTAFV